ncbi:hypothetical protein JKP88DRAFT_242797 [Tribonema minus]|uniref:Uncharacterized protein n=1 Tax=Tribonema minus TaxID=303371 RepID=A0A835ZIP3_9STRA|nr:hypothetical protein JKP88DRAFT_242797 [Tribonema minus]
MVPPALAAAAAALAAMFLGSGERRRTAHHRKNRGGPAVQSEPCPRHPRIAPPNSTPDHMQAVPVRLAMIFGSLKEHRLCQCLQCAALLPVGGSVRELVVRSSSVRS